MAAHLVPHTWYHQSPSQASWRPLASDLEEATYMDEVFCLQHHLHHQLTHSVYFLGVMTHRISNCPWIMFTSPWNLNTSFVYNQCLDSLLNALTKTIFRHLYYDPCGIEFNHEVVTKIPWVRYPIVINRWYFPFVGNILTGWPVLILRLGTWTINWHPWLGQEEIKPFPGKGLFMLLAIQLRIVRWHWI